MKREQELDSKTSVK